MAQVKMCFWCLKPLDEKENFDKDKDKMLFTGYTPCPRCQEFLSKGIHVMGVQTQPMMPDQPAISKTNEGEPLYPTGAMMAAPEEWVKEFLNEEQHKPLLDEVLKQRVMMIPNNIMEDILTHLDDDVPTLTNPDLIEKQQKEGKIATGSMTDQIGEE